MIRAALISIAFAGLLTGCTTTQINSAIAITTTVEAEIGAGILQQCQTTIPSLESIGAIASTFVPGATALDTVINNTVNAVCSAVASVVANTPVTASAALVGKPITIVVNGVTVTGTYGGHH